MLKKFTSCYVQRTNSFVLTRFHHLTGNNPRCDLHIFFYSKQPNYIHSIVDAITEQTS